MSRTELTIHSGSVGRAHDEVADGQDDRGPEEDTRRGPDGEPQAQRSSDKTALDPYVGSNGEQAEHSNIRGQHPRPDSFTTIGHLFILAEGSQQRALLMSARPRTDLLVRYQKSNRFVSLTMSERSTSSPSDVSRRSLYTT